MKKNKLLAFLLSVLMVMTMFPVVSLTAFAAADLSHLETVPPSATCIAFDEEISSSEALAYARANIPVTSATRIVYAKKGEYYYFLRWLGGSWYDSDPASLEDLLEHNSYVCTFGHVFFINQITDSTTTVKLQNEDMTQEDAIKAAEAGISAPREDTLLAYSKNGENYNVIEYSAFNSCWSSFSECTLVDLIRHTDLHDVYCIGIASETPDYAIIQMTSSTTSITLKDANMSKSEALEIANREYPYPVEEMTVIFGVYNNNVYRTFDYFGSWMESEYYLDELASLASDLLIVYIAPAPTTYNVTVDTNITNGTVTADRAAAEKDATVTLTVAPNAGYELDTLTVNDGNGNLATTGSAGTYTFTMGEKDVTVSATFKKIHTHEYTYTADGVTLTATCSCGDKQTVTLKANNATYDGKSHGIILDGSVDGVALTDVKYYNGTEEVSGTPVNAGTYTAKLTKSDAAAKVNFYISPVSLKVSDTVAKEKDYDGTVTAAVIPGELVGIIADDDVSIDTATAAFDTADAGKNKSVTVNYTLKGAKAGNYTVEGSTVTGIINKADIEADITAENIKCNALTVKADIKNCDTEKFVEYAISTESNPERLYWQDIATFTGLDVESDYYVFVKITGVKNYNDFTSTGLKVTTSAHDIVNHDAKPATCTENGWKAYKTCKNCDYTTYAEIEAKGHDYVDHAAKAPTCTEIGWNAYKTCKNCEYTTYEEISATGHNFGEWTDGVRACQNENCEEIEECTHDGVKAGETCPTCGTEIPATQSSHSIAVFIAAIITLLLAIFGFIAVRTAA